MILLLFLLFVSIPVVELTVLIRVGSEIGVANTIAAVILMGLAGAWIAKREGRRSLLAIQRALQEGRLPDNELLGGVLVFVGGLLMITPGFVTDVFGLFLIWPPTRHIALYVIRKHLAKKVRFQTVVFGQNHHPNFDGRPIRDVTPKNTSRGERPGRPDQTSLLT